MSLKGSKNGPGGGTKFFGAAASGGGGFARLKSMIQKESNKAKVAPSPEGSRGSSRTSSPKTDPKQDLDDKDAVESFVAPARSPSPDDAAQAQLPQPGMVSGSNSGNVSLGGKGQPPQPGLSGSNSGNVSVGSALR